MKTLLSKVVENPLIPGKRLALTVLVVSWLLMPELLWHKATIIVHLLYETIAFLLEEFLTHGLGMTKYYAQMLVFYLFWATGTLFVYGLWRRLPGWIHRFKTQSVSFGLRLKYQASEAWMASSMLQKLKFLFFQFVLLAGSFVFLLS